MENLTGQRHDTELNITNLNQQSQADRGNRSRINRLPRSLATGGEDVEAALETQGLEWFYQMDLVSPYSPTGQVQQGGSAQGMESDSAQNLQTSTSTRGHNDDPSLPREYKIEMYGLDISPDSQESVQPSTRTEYHIDGHLNQQSQADRGNRSRINRLPRSLATGGEDVEAALETQGLEWFFQMDLLSPYSPTGQVQQGGSAQGMESDSAQNLQTSTSTRGHNDDPSLPREYEIEMYGLDISPDSQESVQPSTRTEYHIDGHIDGGSGSSLMPCSQESLTLLLIDTTDSQESVQPSTRTEYHIDGHIDGGSGSSLMPCSQESLTLLRIDTTDSQESVQPSTRTEYHIDGHIDGGSGSSLMPCSQESLTLLRIDTTDSQESLQPSTRTEYHIDGHIDGGSGSSLMPCSQESLTLLRIDTTDSQESVQPSTRTEYHIDGHIDGGSGSSLMPCSQESLTLLRIDTTDSQESVQPSTRTEYHIDGHIDGGSDSSQMPCSQESLTLLRIDTTDGYSQQAIPRSGYSPNKSREGEDHGQIRPPNQVSYDDCMPVVVLDRNQSDELGRFFQMPPKPKKQRKESAVQEHDASANDFSEPPYYQGKDPMEGQVPSSYDNNSKSLPHINQKSLPHINLKRCSHLRHKHSGGIPVDRNQSDALGRLYFQKSPKHKKCSLELAVQEEDASAKEFSGPPEYQSKDPMEGTSAGASMDAQKCPLFWLFKGGLDLKAANEILCPETPESQQGSKRRKYIVPSEEHGFITEVEESDPIEEDTVLNQAEGSDALVSFNAVSIDGSSAAECYNTITNSANWKHVSTEDSKTCHHGFTTSISQDTRLSALRLEFPANPSLWSSQDVILFLTKSADPHLQALVGICEKFKLDGHALMLLERNMLIDCMGINVGPALKLCNFVNYLKEGYGKGARDRGSGLGRGQP